MDPTVPRFVEAYGESTGQFLSLAVGAVPFEMVKIEIALGLLKRVQVSVVE